MSPSVRGVSRRQFLASMTAVSLGFGGLQSLFARSAWATPASHRIAEGFGPLLPDPASILELPAGFSYRVLSTVGDPMRDGLLVPGRADGMAAFAGPGGETLLICNHEQSQDNLHTSPFGKENEQLGAVPRELFYDYGFGKTPCLGGTTTLVIDSATGALRRQYLSLAGTSRNCAGGPTPWGSWISCEETVDRAGNACEKDHGYCFEVPAAVDAAPVAPVALEAMGRFNHEAIAIDPVSGVVYLTEDRPDGAFYRFIPRVPGKLAEGGRLQALCFSGAKGFDTRNWRGHQLVSPGNAYVATWIDLDDVTAKDDDLRKRAQADGAAIFARGEGIWHGEGAVFFACTNGGNAEKGQIWRYIPSPHEGTPGEQEKPGAIQLFLEPNDGGLLDNADNLTVAPWGDLIVCEDGSGDQFLVGVTPDGGIYKFARNAHPSRSEFAGACFSPDGATLFVNVQSAGLTLAITGPWKQRQKLA